MKLTLEEFKEKVNDYDIDDDIKISILEDLSDSFTDDDNEDEYKLKYLELRERYKNRFLNSEDIEDTDDDIDVNDDDVDTKKIVDVREI